MAPDLRFYLFLVGGQVDHIGVWQHFGAFSDLAPRTELEVDLRQAEYVAELGRICSWDRAMQTATPEELAHYANADSGWLAECINRPPP